MSRLAAQAVVVIVAVLVWILVLAGIYFYAPKFVVFSKGYSQFTVS